ncbi:MAG: hypothetical protein L3J26_10865 [Candidatus Polarisedimenticolaceae bacterium]|nr:hypothetical protein [Candidatus Polarisedimenticolaceae bacterium]
MKGNKLLLLRLLLIAIMVLQPAVSAYAMTAMDHNPGDAAPPAMQDHKMGHDAMHQGMDNNAPSASMEREGCCTSDEACTMAACPMSACSTMLFTNAISVSKIKIALTTPTYQPSWVGISLPTEIRPPRSPLG